MNESRRKFIRNAANRRRRSDDPAPACHRAGIRCSERSVEHRSRWSGRYGPQQHHRRLKQGAAAMSSTDPTPDDESKC